MKVPFVDLKAQHKSVRAEINTAICDVLDNASFILGKCVSDFETAFARKHAVRYCYGLSSGTAGNHTVLWALDIRPGDEVIVPANTFIATAWGAILCGATPVFVDCEPDSYNIDPEKVEVAITPHTKAIVAVHLYGQSANFDPLQRVADKYDVRLLEDCAQAHCAEYKGRKVGGLGIAASFSFYPSKNLGACGEAGAVTTNSQQLGERFRMLRDHGSSRKYWHEMYGHNYRMEGIQGAVLGIKLKYLDRWTEERRRAAAKYRELLADVEEIQLPQEMDYAKHVYHLFVIQVKNQQGGIRDQLANFLNENGVSTGLHYPIPLHLQPCFQPLRYKKGAFPVTERLASHGLSLPIYPELTNEQVSYVAEKIHEFFLCQR